MREQKFSECRSCRFYNAARPDQPICRECGVGEFYEERSSRRNLTSLINNSSYHEGFLDD